MEGLKPAAGISADWSGPIMLLQMSVAAMGLRGGAGLLIPRARATSGFHIIILSLDVFRMMELIWKKCNWACQESWHF